MTSENLNILKWLTDIVKEDGKLFIISLLLISNAFTLKMYIDQRREFDVLSDKYVTVSETIRKEMNEEKDIRIAELRQLVITLNNRIINNNKDD